ncbi:CpsD/CapB family tyrosine-protein kinase [Aerococcaceae bacterium DSM 111020]|nr:CpsD/CapB family tyrosine-protein kinase [Aerococcaceae bacterium DSM 111020]
MFKRHRHARKLTEQKKGASLITHLQPNSVTAEEFRNIRTNIEFSGIDQDLKSFLVTSSMPFEGKSTVSSNLASVYSQMEKKVLYVDADLRKPMLHRSFNVSNDTGLSTILASKSEITNLNNIIMKGPNENLYLLPTGPIPPNPAELLASRRMGALMQRLEEYFDLIIYDTPPVIPVTDSQILASQVDGVVVVARYNYTTKNTINQTKEKLEAVEANILGYVLNAVTGNHEEYGYGEYYGD